jgi:uncharacterized protein (DUF2062 family)
MVDVEMMEACGEELAERFESQQATKVSSPFAAPACLGVLCVGPIPGTLLYPFPLFL